MQYCAELGHGEIEDPGQLARHRGYRSGESEVHLTFEHGATAERSREAQDGNEGGIGGTGT